PNQGGGQKRGRGGKKGKKGSNKQDQTQNTQAGSGQAPENDGNQKNKSKVNGNNSKQNRRKPKQKKKYPWRRFIPKGTVDPITLENLQTLEYPPFALCADEPYVPVPEWPIPDKPKKAPKQGKKKESASGALPATKAKSEADLEVLHKQRLAEQWGAELVSTDTKANESNQAGSSSSRSKSSDPPNVPSPSERPYNLFDGRALAYYMVSQLQFIDPLNRRDLTRPELVNLDEYLARHGHTDLKVTEAYDAKGITISSAGAAASTAQGRADIMQQTAQQLLNSLFSGQSVTSGRATDNSNARSNNRQQETPSFSLQEQYAAMQRQEQARAQQRHDAAAAAANRSNDPYLGDSGVYGSINNDGGGFMIIDDDENPELRGRNDFPSLAAPTGAGNAGYSASHIANRYGGGGRVPSSTGPAFPALPNPAPHRQTAAAPATVAPNAKKPAPKASKTLFKISGLVKKTDPEEQQRQWEAREAARRRAAMSNLSYGMDPSMSNPGASLNVPPSASAAASGTGATNEMLERNKAFAEALGVKPATHRHYKSGWARPTETEVTLDEFGNELNAALYPEPLIAMARERMPQLLKLEKKWKTFLADDKSASLPLNPMDRSTRAFVHAYAEFWDLKTESFDPEPKRYIHCVKLLATHAPHPLLSEAAKNWRGSLPDVSNIQLSDHSSLQTAGQISKSRDLPAAAASVPVVVNSRVDAFVGKERPKLELAARSVPLELPPFEEQKEDEAASAYDAAEDLRRQQARLEEKRQKQREAELKKKQALEDAFASDDESDSDAKPAARAATFDDEWGEEPQPLYDGSEDED
ncbi:MAG: hypothetical protein SGILL_007692, partial [Bacillariaceae sp.]